MSARRALAQGVGPTGALTEMRGIVLLCAVYSVFVEGSYCRPKAIR